MSEKIKNILLEHVGRQNAIKAKHISSLLGFPMEDTQSVSRKAIWDTAEEYGLPLETNKSLAKKAEEAKAEEKVEEVKEEEPAPEVPNKKSGNGLIIALIIT